MSDWREQVTTVEGRKFPLSKIQGGKLYHGSPAKIPLNSVLSPQQQRNFKESPTNLVCFTSDYSTAIYWAKKASPDSTNIYVYEIEPSTPVIVHRIMPANYGKNINLLEGRAKQATILAITEATAL